MLEQNSCGSTESRDLSNISPQRTRRNSRSAENSTVLSDPVPCNHGRASLRRAPPFRAHCTSPPGLGCHLRDLCVLLFEMLFASGRTSLECVPRSAHSAGSTVYPSSDSSTTQVKAWCRPDRLAGRFFVFSSSRAFVIDRQRRHRFGRRQPGPQNRGETRQRNDALEVDPKSSWLAEGPKSGNGRSV
jgi:hypothetical protein